VLVALAGATLVAFLVTRNVVSDQEDRILHERTGEITLLLQSAVEDLSASLRPVALAARLGGLAAFAKEARAQRGAGGAPRTFALVQLGGGHLSVAAVAGPRLARGDVLSGAREAAVERALARSELVATPVFRSGGRRLLGFALGPPLTAPRTAAYLELRLNPPRAAGVAQQRPFHEVEVLLYATPKPDRNQLLVATTSDLALHGDDVRAPIKAGDQRWLLAVRPRQPLVGSFAEAAPWIILGVGLLGAVLATVVVLVLVRRRDYALALVAERTVQLEEANRELGAFSYSVSHDLRAPLRAIDGFSRLLLDEYADELPSDARRYLGLVGKNAQEMSRLIDGLLTFSRLGQQRLSKRSVKVDTLAREVVAELDAERSGRAVEISIGALPSAQADPTLLRQVLVNLLSNALKYTRQREAAKIEIGFHEHGGPPVFFVRDNGVGFDTRYANKLFQVFQRLHRAEEYEGTGLGLALVARIVRRHGGRIWAEAKPDEGATFYFTLEGGEA
jgi:signal transduction histidine kinase